MTSTARIDDSEKGARFRANEGLEVAPLWQAGNERLIVEVVDTKVGDASRHEVVAAEAPDAFQHPYAYAAFRGVDYTEPWLLQAEPVSE
jgi:hypothetical protein